uniref:Uncharacterized protein n=1 Tax=Varanus komodoensis TaxID=61221 RepID=A0A8D2LM08_VARKO
VLGAGEVLGHERRGRLLAAPQAPAAAAAAEALGRLGHVVAPLGLVELHLLLAVRQEGQVGERLLLAQVGGQRRAALHAARLEHLQLGRLGRRHPGRALGAGALGQHGLAALGGPRRRRRRRRLLEAAQLLRPVVAAQPHVLRQALDSAAGAAAAGAAAAAAAAAEHLRPARREETI